MTKLFLVRHGETDSVGRSLSGRLPGIPLNARGEEEARVAAEKLAVVPLTAVYSSPLERTLQTATLLAQVHGLEVISRPAWMEIDFGDWTGRSFDDLSADPLWPAFNLQRNTFRIPGGESFRDVRLRLEADLAEIASIHQNQTIAVVTHADIIRTALCISNGQDLTHMLSWSVETGSIHPLTRRP